jgi:hypothetical protein
MGSALGYGICRVERAADDIGLDEPSLSIRELGHDE